MDKRLRFLIVTIVLALWVGTPILSQAQSTVSGDVTPDNTVILASEADARFSRDFSILLKQLHLEWIVLDRPVVPESVHDQNLVILGHPDAVYTGDIIRSLLTAEEIDSLRSATDRPAVIEKESPWLEDRTVTVCSGADLLLTRDAAEMAVRKMIEAAPPAADWIQTAYDGELDEEARVTIDRLRYEWDDEELRLVDLTMDVEARRRRRVSAQEAAEDVERLFYLLSHGYAGYGVFSQDGQFEEAREQILEELSTQSSWSSDSFSRLLHDHLSFIVDCHMKIGEHRFAGHADFWYDTDLEVTLGQSGYRFVIDDEQYTATSVNGSNPAPFLFPSLNQEGESVYRLGTLATEEPAPLLLAGTSEAGRRQFEIALHRSDFDYYSDDIFREDVIGGIPVVRARGFGDYHAEELSQFAETGRRLRGEPAVILDIRGNGGGNERWPVRWIQGLTGQRAESVLIVSELESKTTMMGRANYFTYHDHAFDMPNYGVEGAQYTRAAQAIERGGYRPNWTGPVYPRVPLIPNDTTVIVVINEYVASAGEGLVMRISQAENVVVVGENTMGALTFGNVSLHQLPHSKLKVWLPINFNLFLDMESREAVGLAPDLWVPAADAVNYAVAAVRNGTIPTAQPLPSETLGADFVPESPWTMARKKTAILFLAVTVGGVVFAASNRRKPHIVAAVGTVSLVVSILWIISKREDPVGYGFVLTGIVCLVWGGYGLWSARGKRKITVEGK